MKRLVMDATCFLALGFVVAALWIVSARLTRIGEDVKLLREQPKQVVPPPEPKPKEPVKEPIKEEETAPPRWKGYSHLELSLYHLSEWSDRPNERPLWKDTMKLMVQRLELIKKEGR